MSKLRIYTRFLTPPGITVNDKKKEYNLNIYPKKELAVFSLKNIGDVSLYSLNVGRMIELGKSLGKDVKDCRPDEYIEMLFKFILVKNEKPISSEDVEKITEDEKEEILKKLIEESPSMYLENTTEKTKNDKGETVIKMGYGDVEHPQHENETYKDYFYRLSVLQEKEFADRARQMTDRLKSSLNFSAGLNSRITDVFKNINPIANQLSHIQKMAQISQPFADLHKSLSSTSHLSTAMKEMDKRNSLMKSVTSSPKIDPLISKDFKLHIPKDHKLEVLNNLNDSFDVMTAKMEDFVEITAMMLNELKSSSDHSRESSKQNVKLTYIVIGITLILGMLTIYTTIKVSDSSTDALLPPMEEMVKNIKMQDTNNGDKNSQIIELLKKNIESNERILKELRKPKKVTAPKKK